MEVQFVRAETDRQLAAIAELFCEYEQWIDDARCSANLIAEIGNLPGAYAPPDGRLMLVMSGAEFVGCGALRRFDDQTVEMKRIYLRDRLRGFGIGKRLVETLIAEARKAGWGRIVLDTLPKMEAAGALYRKIGFAEVDGPPPDPGTIFLEIKL